MLHLLWILSLFPLDERQFWGYSQWQSSAHRRKLHSHYSQRDSLWPGTVPVSCVQSCQQWHQWSIKLYHQLWVILSPPMYYICPVSPSELWNAACLCSSLFSDGPDNMVLTVNGNNSTSFSVGSNLSMLCSAQSNPPALLHWAIRGELVNTTGPLLELFSVSEDQSGPYSCLASNNHTNKNSTITTNIMISSWVCLYLDINFHTVFVHLFPTSSLFCSVSAESGSEQQAVSVWLLPLLLLFGPLF